MCVRCGRVRADYLSVCPGCGERPEGEARQIAWLLSAHHLEMSELEQVSERVRGGEVIRPSRRMLKVAQRALGQSWASDSGLTLGEKLTVLAVGFLCTPLPGLVWGFWWRVRRPRSAAQSVLLSLPAALCFTAWVLQRVVVRVGG